MKKFILKALRVLALSTVSASVIVLLLYFGFPDIFGKDWSIKQRLVIGVITIIFFSYGNHLLKGFRYKKLSKEREDPVVKLWEENGKLQLENEALLKDFKTTSWLLNRIFVQMAGDLINGNMGIVNQVNAEKRIEYGNTLQVIGKETFPEYFNLKDEEVRKGIMKKQSTGKDIIVNGHM